MIQIKEVKVLFWLPDAAIPSTGAEAIDLTYPDNVPKETDTVTNVAEGTHVDYAKSSPSTEEIH